MKQIYYLLTAMLFFQTASSQILKNCLNSCDLPSANWSTVQCENYELLSVGQDLLTSDWYLYPSSSGYFPVSAMVGLGHIGTSWVTYADFNYNGQPVDNYFKLNFAPRDYRFNFSIYLFQNQRAQLAIKDDANKNILYLEFTSSGIVNIYNSSNAKIGSFTYSQNTWVAMSAFYHNDGRLEIFRNNYKVGGINNAPTGTKTFPSRYDFFSDKSGDGFLLGGVCVATQNGFQVLCTQEFDPVCLKGTGEQIANNACYARVMGYFENEFQKCGVSNDPCADCDECFNYWFDCSDYRKLYLQNNYCDEPILQLNHPWADFLPGTEYEWEFKNSNNVVIQPEFLNSTSSTSYSPICRLPLSGSYTVCLKVFKYQESGRYLAYTCCYVVQVALPCKNTPTVLINSGTVASNGEISFTTTTTDADNFSWRCGNASANIPNQPTGNSSFKCKFPSGVNCMTVCLTVGNACGMISKCITVCNSNSGCGPKPPSHPPITYLVNNNGEVSFNNIPLMDSYDWVIPSGCSFTGGTDRGSRSPICKIPDLNCNYIFCLKMKLGCYTCCYCFTIRKGGSGGTVTFDPDEMSCVPTNTGIKVPVRVKSFENMSSVDLTFTLSPSNVANFVSAEAGPNVDLNSIIPNLLSNNRLQVAWIGTAGVNTTLQDNDILFYLLLNTTGASNSSATISIESATAKVKQNRVNVPSILQTGSVCINGSFRLCGRILREDNAPVKGVNVTLNGTASQSTTTDDQGNYCFTSVPAGTYSIKPRKTNFPGNGVEADDLSDLKGHLLQTYILPTPYRLIAADVDNNKQITATDIARIIPTFKDKSRVFVNVDSWRFVSKSFQFPNASNPFQSTFPEVISITVNKDLSNLDFVGIKMADLNLDNDPQNLKEADPTYDLSKHLSQRSIPIIDLIIPSDTVRPGSILKLPVYCKGFHNVLSFGFSVNWEKNKLKFLKVNQFNSKLGLSNSNFALQNTLNGNFGVTWYTFDVNGISLTDKEPIFYIEFEVMAADKEKCAVAFSNLPTPITFADPLESFQVNPTAGTITVDALAVGVIELLVPTGKIYAVPNPVMDHLTIRSSDFDFNTTIYEVRSIVGETYSVPICKGKSECSLDASSLMPGTYILTVRDKSKYATLRFLKF